MTVWGEMLEQIGSWMDFNAQTRHKITPEHAYELDVAWLSGKNPEVAVEVQISGKSYWRQRTGWLRQGNSTIARSSWLSERLRCSGSML